MIDSQIEHNIMFELGLYKSTLMETKMELINDFLWVEDKPQDNSKFINDQPTASIVYLNSQLLQHSNQG